MCLDKHVGMNTAKILFFIYIDTDYSIQHHIVVVILVAFESNNKMLLNGIIFINVNDFGLRPFNYVLILHISFTAQLIVTLCYKPAGNGFDSRWDHWDFSSI
jgi:hypothetical protein